MREQKSRRWLFVLMIVSQIMLTFLGFQWLKSQWQIEHETLYKEIDLKFRESVNQVLDTMLIKHVIDPVLNDSTDHLAGNASLNKNVSDRKKSTSSHISTGGKMNGTVTSSLADSLRNTEGKSDFDSYDSTEKKLLLRGIKLIISKTGESVGEKRQFGHTVLIVPDTILIKKLFINKLGTSGSKLKIRWISDSTRNNSEQKGGIMYFKSALFKNPFNAEISHFQPVILKGILPQILFIIILLTFTGAAFFYTNRSLNKMIALNTLRDDFVNNISHELRTPVSTVSVALEALKNFDKIKDQAKTNEYLDISINEMKRLDMLITRVLDASILEGQHQYLQLEEADIIKLTNDVLGSMQARFSQCNARVKFNQGDGISLLKLDRLLIEGVLFNLIDNSLKYASDNPEITISIEQKSSSVLLRIRDNGPGIPEEYISRLFDKFFRVPKGDVHNVKGFGLGLSFAKLVMQNHSGSIGVRNINKSGCEFTLTFPVDKK